MDNDVKLDEKIEGVVERKLAERGLEAPSGEERVDRTSTRDANDSTTSPTRRGVLGAGGAGLAGLLLGSSATGTASAQAAGSVGTPDSPVDVYAGDVVADSADLGQLASSLDAAGNAISNLPEPQNDGDAAPKSYVDASGGGGDPSAVEGISNGRDHVGALRQGDLIHTPGDDLWGIHFWAEGGLVIDSVVLEFDADQSSASSGTVELWEAEVDDSNGKNDSVAPSAVDSPVATQSVSVEGGPNRHALEFTIPEDGEYFLGVRGDVALRRASDWSGWSDYARSDIDLMFGGRFDNPTNSDYSTYYYYVFDLAVGPATTRVTSPHSTDVEEIYMRPNDPTEEFDDVSSRALWLDTSE